MTRSFIIFYNVFIIPYFEKRFFFYSINLALDFSLVHIYPRNRIS